MSTSEGRLKKKKKRYLYDCFYYNSYCSVNDHDVNNFFYFSLICFKLTRTIQTKCYIHLCIVSSGLHPLPFALLMTFIVLLFFSIIWPTVVSSAHASLNLQYEKCFFDWHFSPDSSCSICKPPGLSTSH